MTEIIYGEDFEYRRDVRSEPLMKKNLEDGYAAQKVVATIFSDLGYDTQMIADEVNGNPDLYLGDWSLEVQNADTFYYCAGHYVQYFPETADKCGIHLKGNKLKISKYKTLFLFQATPKKVYLLDLKKNSGYGPLPIKPWGGKQGYFFTEDYLDKYCLTENNSNFETTIIEQLWFERWTSKKDREYWVKFWDDSH